jgi:hypothetical protein
MPFSFFRIPGLFRCPVDGARLVARRNIRRAPGPHEDVLARGEA